mmetsp:Transcript_13549/g.31136  ORF Transcript_13549/g.31136 Transcript_13549/m.31136 type:complete len:266 (-) Transcript_13549:144-941(-)
MSKPSCERLRVAPLRPQAVYTRRVSSSFGSGRLHLQHGRRQALDDRGERESFRSDLARVDRRLLDKVAREGRQPVGELVARALGCALRLSHFLHLALDALLKRARVPLECSDVLREGSVLLVLLLVLSSERLRHALHLAQKLSSLLSQVGSILLFNAHHRRLEFREKLLLFLCPLLGRPALLLLDDERDCGSHIEVGLALAHVFLVVLVVFVAPLLLLRWSRRDCWTPFLDCRSGCRRLGPASAGAAAAWCERALCSVVLRCRRR